VSEVDNRIITLLLLSLLVLVLTLGAALVFLVIHWRRQAGMEQPVTTKNHNQYRARLSFRSSFLNRPYCWLAIKSRNPLAVQAALGLNNPRRCSWAEGLVVASEKKFFISPPVDGWILVIGSALPDPADDVDACYRFVLDLSRQLGHVQFFSASRILNNHAWVKVETGRVLRAYAWAGKTLWKQGLKTVAETELGLKCFDYLEATEHTFFELPETVIANVEKVPLLAARWSIDPASIDERFFKQARGIAGEPSRFKRF